MDIWRVGYVVPLRTSGGLLEFIRPGTNFRINIKGPPINSGSRGGEFLVQHGKWKQDESNLDSLSFAILLKEDKFTRRAYTRAFHDLFV
jgi:hypothetical protein